MIVEMPCGYGTLRTTGVRTWNQVSSRACANVSAALEVSCRACAEVSAFLEVSCSPSQRSQQLQNLKIVIVNLVAF
jgi:hypothetical protein